MVTPKQERILNTLYGSHGRPYGLSSQRKLFSQASTLDPTIKLEDVKEFLRGSKTYTLHKLQNKRFPRQKVLACRPGVIIAADLADVRHIKKFNDNTSYLLVCVDVFSRFMHVYPCVRKDASTMLDAIKNVLESPECRRVRRLNTDQGTEFYNQKVKQYLNSRGIILYSVHSSEIKASIAERAIRTLKSRIYRFITYRGTPRYIDHLQDMVDAYNHSPHSGLKKQQTPFEVQQLTHPTAIIKQFKLMYKTPPSSNKRLSSDLEVGETVRLVGSQRSSSFHKGYTQQNTHELFRISRIKHPSSPRTYLLEDLEGKPLEGIFYGPELVPSKVPEGYDINILNTHTRGKVKQYYVHWVGFPTSSDSWIDASDLTQR